MYYVTGPDTGFGVRKRILTQNISKGYSQISFLKCPLAISKSGFQSLLDEIVRAPFGSESSDLPFHPTSQPTFQRQLREQLLTK